MIILISLVAGCTNRDHNQRQGVVASATPEASNAGVEILRLGGNAVDAAVAVSFALAVTEPAMSGLGGGTQMLISIPDGEPFMINGTTYSPALTPSSLSENKLTYRQRSTIPSTVKTLSYAWAKYGSGNISWNQLLEPAIRLAKNGFRVGEFRHKVFNRYADKLKDSPFNTSFFLINGEIPGVGDTLKQPVLSSTLTTLAEKGARDFYTGDIATAIAEDMATNQGWITLSDLNDFPDPVEVPAININYRDHEVYTSAPPCGGWVMLLALNSMATMKQVDLQNDSLWIRHILSSLKFAHNDRLINPVINLKEYDREIEAKLSHGYIDKFIDEVAKEGSGDNGETTHFSIVDETGIAVSVTSSINAYFGALAASPKLGFLYNTYMDDFIFGDPTNPYSVGPGKMAYSSMTPTIVQRDDRTVLVLGSPGSGRIISSVAQVISSWIDLDLSIEQAVAKPRLHVTQERAYIERILDSTQIALTLASLDLDLTSPRTDLSTKGLNAYFGGVHAIAFENGEWVGAADPRRDGSVTYQ